jgi:hypothetical protein
MCHSDCFCVAWSCCLPVDRAFEPVEEIIARSTIWSRVRPAVAVMPNVAHFLVLVDSVVVR